MSEELLNKVESEILGKEIELCYCGVDGHDHTTYRGLSVHLIDLIQRNTESKDEWVSVEKRLPTEIGFKYPVSNGDFIDYDIFDGEVWIEFGDQVTDWMDVKPPQTKSEA